MSKSTDVHDSILAVMRRCPGLTAEGLDGRQRPHFEDRRASLLKYPEAFEHARKWLGLVPWRTAPNTDCDSYRIKHVIERWSGAYMPNGVCIAAALDLGVPIAPCQDGINAWLGIERSGNWPASIGS